MYLCICTTKDNIDKSNSSAESLIEESNDSDFKPLGDSLTLASSSNFSSEEELSDKSIPSKHRSTRNIFLKKDEVVIDKDMFSFDDTGDDGNGISKINSKII